MSGPERVTNFYPLEVLHDFFTKTYFFCFSHGKGKLQSKVSLIEQKFDYDFEKKSTIVRTFEPNSDLFSN